MDELEAGQFFGRARGTRSSCVVTLAETRYGLGERVPRHRHRTGSFCLVLEGCLEECVDASPHRIDEGRVLFHPSTLPHAERFPSAPTRIFNVQLEASWVHGLGEMGFELPSEQRVAGSRSELSWLSRRVREEWHRGDALASLAVEGLVLEMVVTLLRNPPHKAERERPAWVLQVQDAIHASFPESLSLIELAAEVEIDPSHLSRTFGRCFGCPPGEYLRRLRVDTARRALEASDASLSQIALATGFADQSHFTRTFRRYLGTTPGAYRAAHVDNE